MTPYTDVLLEVCVDSPVSAAAAEEGGADRIELCADLGSGGTTPSSGIIANTRECVEIPLFVMVRPHGGAVIGDMDFEVMKHDVIQAKYLGVDGIVTGILTRSREIDLLRMEELVKLARPMEVTFHRAFDLLGDRTVGLTQLINLGVARILTSGGSTGAGEHQEELRQLVVEAGNKIRILVGGGVTLENIAAIRAATRAKEMHVLSAATHAEPLDSQGSAFPGRWLVDPEKVSRLKAALAV